MAWTSVQLAGDLPLDFFILLPDLVARAFTTVWAAFTFAAFALRAETLNKKILMIKFYK